MSLTALNTQAYSGRPWPLIEGTGQIYGMYVLTGMQTTRTELDCYGKAKKIEFSISFQRCDEDLRERLQSSSFSDLMDNARSSANDAVNAVNAVKGLF